MPIELSTTLNGLEIAHDRKQQNHHTSNQSNNHQFRVSVEWICILKGGTRKEKKNSEMKFQMRRHFIG